MREVPAMNHDTLQKLRKMRLPAFAKAYAEQANDPDTYSTLTFDERLSLLVDAEFDTRATTR